jgi:hypothetical protein
MAVECNSKVLPHQDVLESVKILLDFSPTLFLEMVE